MYIMSQDGKRIVQLDCVDIRKNETGCYLYTYNRDEKFGALMATYHTEPEAKAQLAGIAAALLRGTPIYCFD